MIKIQYDNTTGQVYDAVSGKLSETPIRKNCSIVELNLPMPEKVAPLYKYDARKKDLVEMAEFAKKIETDNVISERKRVMVERLAKEELISDGILNLDGTLK